MNFLGRENSVFFKTAFIKRKWKKIFFIKLHISNVAPNPLEEKKEKEKSRDFVVEHTSTAVYIIIVVYH